VKELLMYFFQDYGIEKSEKFHLIQLTDADFPAHCHPAYEFIFVTQGSAQVWIDGQKYALKPNDGALIFSNQVHRFVLAANTKLDLVIFSGELLSDFHYCYQNKLPTFPVVHAMKLPFKPSANSSTFEVKAYLYWVCEQFVKNTTFRTREKDISSDLFSQLLQWVLANYQKECNLKSLAEEFSYDYQYLSKLFKQKTGIGFNHYVNLLRILKAEELLEATDDSVQTIAETVGYNSLRSFHRNYKAITGHAPLKKHLR